MVEVTFASTRNACARVRVAEHNFRKRFLSSAVLCQRCLGGVRRTLDVSRPLPGCNDSVCIPSRDGGPAATVSCTSPSLGSRGVGQTHECAMSAVAFRWCGSLLRAASAEEVQVRSAVDQWRNLGERRSRASANSNAPAKAVPEIAAITGFGMPRTTPSPYRESPVVVAFLGTHATGSTQDSARPIAHRRRNAINNRARRQ